MSTLLRFLRHFVGGVYYDSLPWKGCWDGNLKQLFSLVNCEEHHSFERAGEEWLGGWGDGELKEVEIDETE